MKKFTLNLCILFALLSFSINGIAGQINKEEAGKAGRNFIYEKINIFNTPTAYQDIILKDCYEHKAEENTWFYAFNLLDEGFVIVSAHDMINPVIGYSFEGNFPQNPDMNSNYGRFLQTYVDGIKYALEHDIQCSAEITEKWKRLLQDDISGTEITSGRDRSVEPLVSSLWNQGSPYNIMCPEDNLGPGGHVYAGCVATSMSQVMHYWRHPQTGYGSHGYSSNYGWLEVNFGETDYDWTGMMNVIDSDDPWGIAELQYHAGVAVEMQYSPDGSGAWVWDACDAMKTYFKYPGSEYLDRENYSTQDWTDIIVTELDNGRPLVYAGYSSSGGHAFVCDGYQGDDFHFNFGWGGSSNGFYTLDDVGGFSSWQQCIRNIIPLDTEYPNYVSGAIEINRMSGSFTDGSGPIENYLDNTTASWLINPQTAEDSVSAIDLDFSKFELGNNDVLTIYDGGSASAPVLGTYTGTNGPGTLTTTSNQVLIEFVSDGSEPGPGFYAEFKAILPEYCSGFTTLTAESGTFNDGSNSFNYGNNSLCFWKIQPESQTPITIYFNQFETEEVNDFVTVYDNTTVVGTFSGNELPGSITATSGIALIAFKTNNFNTAGGWEITFETETVDIGAYMENADVAVFPNPVPKGERINIHLKDIPDSKPYSVEIHDITGRVIRNFLIEPGYLKFKAPERNGLYFIKILNKTTVITTRKIIVCD